MHHCANVVCGPEGEASAVLLRAGEVVEGLDTAASRRGGAVRDLARGPARLCDALAIDLSHKGTSLFHGPVRLELGEPLDPAAIAVGPRVGLRLAAERPWRFWIADDPTVSRYVPAKPRARRTP